MAKISVIIPVYNVEEYVGACLDSVEAQTVKPYEVIMVDDGSPDKSGEICESFAARNPESRKVIHQENMGLGGARNTGIASASGDYLFFLDSDDTIDPDAIERIGAAIDKSGADMVISGVRTVFSDGKKKEYPLPFAEGEYSPKKDKALLTITPEAPLKIAKKSLFSDNGIEFPPRVWYEDMRTTPKLLALSQKVFCLEKPFYNYFHREGSIMNSKNVERNSEIIDAMEDLRAFFKEKGLLDTFRRELDFLTVDHVLVSASVRVLRCEKTTHHLTGKFREYTFNVCGDIKKNPYVAAMPRNRRIVLELLLKKLYLAVKLIFAVKD